MFKVSNIQCTIPIICFTMAKAEKYSDKWQLPLCTKTIVLVTHNLTSLILYTNWNTIQLRITNYFVYFCYVWNALNTYTIDRKDNISIWKWWSDLKLREVLCNFSCNPLYLQFAKKEKNCRYKININEDLVFEGRC